MSTPPLSRNNSRDDLNAGSESSEEKSDTEKKQAQTGTSSTPQQNRPRANTWKVAKVTGEDTEQPRLQSKRSQPNLIVAAPKSDSQLPHTVPRLRLLDSSSPKGTASTSSTSSLVSDAKPVIASDTKVTNTALSSSSASVPLATAKPQTQRSGTSVQPVTVIKNFASATSTSNSTSTSATPVISPGSSSSASIASPRTNATEGGYVYAENLPKGLSQIIDAGLQKDSILNPEKLALLLITVESQCGKKPLISSAIDSILRGAQTVLQYTTSSGMSYDKLNIIKMFCEPFMQYHLNSKESEELIKKVMHEYDKVGEKVNALSNGLRPVQQLKHPDIARMMVPVMKLVIDYVCGKEMSLKSSNLPEAIKKLLVAIDRHVILWFEKSGSGQMKDLMEVRKSALIGFLSTRSFMTIWGPKISVNTTNGQGFYAKLNSYMNSYVAIKLDDFVIDILLNQEHQPKEAQIYVKGISKGLALSAKAAETPRGMGKEKPGLLTSLKGLLSPRSSSTSATANEKNKNISRTDASLKNNEIRRYKIVRDRTASVNEFAKIIGLGNITLDFYNHIKNKIIDLSNKEYTKFMDSPIEYSLRELEMYKTKINPAMDTAIYEKIKASIENSYKNLQPAKEKSAPKSTATGIKLDLSAMKNSFDTDEAQNDDDDVESSATEPSSEEKVNEKNKTIDAESASAIEEKKESESSNSVETEKSDE